VLRRTISLNVAEIQIERDQHATFFSASMRYRSIICSRKAFVEYSIGSKTGMLEKDCTLSGKILIDLEFQTVCSRGRSAVPSRASSAA
jgi:hypothetical protein